jgi:hypothetical protein
MAFWSEPNLREPLRQNRWYINFPLVDLKDYTFALKECSKPEYKIETTSHVLLNHTFNYPKNLVWQPITVKMVSAREKENNSLSYKLDLFLKSSGYRRPNDTANKQISKQEMNLGDLSIIQIDSNGANIEEWTLYNPIITNINYGSLTYENDGFVDITFTITYDYAVLKIEEGNVERYYYDGKEYQYVKATEEKIDFAKTGKSTTDPNSNDVTIGRPGFPGAKQ